MKKDTKRLVLQAISGDKYAFGNLYELYYADMYHFALSMCKNSYDAQDAVQETVLSVWKSISNIRNPEKFKSYLFLYLSNTCKKKVSSQNETVEFEDTGYIDSEIEFSVPVREALLKLSETERQIVMLSIAAGFKSREIAEILEIPANTIRTKQRRALEKMRTELGI